jgi:hypothetical protein
LEISQEIGILYASSFCPNSWGLRLLISEPGPIVATSVGLLSTRSVAYLVGLGFGSLASIWQPIIALLISLTGAFNAGSNTPECEAFRAQMRAIYDANRAALASGQIVYKAFLDCPYKNYLSQAQALALQAARSASATCAGYAESRPCVVCGNCSSSNSCCVGTTFYPRGNCESAEIKRLYHFFKDVIEIKNVKSKTIR